MWFTLIIPILACVILYGFFKREIAWWEPLLCFGSSAALTLIFTVSVNFAMLYCFEWCTQPAIRAEYQEAWVEEYETYDEKEKKWETHTTYHPESWEKYGRSGTSYTIDRGEFERLCQLWSNKKHKSIWHANKREGWNDGRGDKFITSWDGDIKSLDPITWKQYYKNKVQASEHTVFKFPPVGRERQKQLFHLPDPDSDHHCRSILGISGGEAEHRLQVQNALLGPEKQVRMWILIFHDEDVQIALDQESFWKGGNKNEFTLCVGIDKENDVKWAYVISWTDIERLKIDVRNFAREQQKLDLDKLVDYMAQEVKGRFVRKQFKDFNYLTVAYPQWSILTAWILTFVVNIVVGVFSVLNPYTEDDPTGESEGAKWPRRKLKS